MIVAWSMRRSLSSLAASALLFAATACKPEPVAVTLVPKPATEQPVEPTPVAGEPVAAKPVAGEPVAGEPVAAKPVAAKPVAVPASAAATAKGETYVACGCGCCGGVEPVKQCLYRAKGEDLATIKKADEKSRKDPQCAMRGCSMGTAYSYCD